MAEQTVHIGDITVTLIPTRVVVHTAPDQALISLAVLAGASPERMWVAGDRIYLGDDERGREICYRVTGWDPTSAALVVTRVPEPPETRATGGDPCRRCGRPQWTHTCLSCSPDALTPGPGCHNCRYTGMDQIPCAATGASQ